MSIKQIQNLLALKNVYRCFSVILYIQNIKSMLIKKTIAHNVKSYQEDVNKIIHSTQDVMLQYTQYVLISHYVWSINILVAIYFAINVWTGFVAEFIDFLIHWRVTVKNSILEHENSNKPSDKMVGEVD